MIASLKIQDVFTEISRLFSLAWHDIDWNGVLRKYGFAYLLEKIPDITLSQTLELQDYPKKVKFLLNTAYSEDPSRAYNMVRDVILSLRRKLEGIVDISRYLELLNTLKK